MKKTLRTLGIIAVCFVVISTFMIIRFSSRFNLGLPFGYYRDYNIAKNALKRSECIDLIKDDIVNKDFTLEDFSFVIHTNSGWKLILRFGEEMDVGELCEHPKGLLFYRPGRGVQVYPLEYLSGALKEKGHKKIENVRDVLCYADDLIAIYRANYDNEEIPCISEIKGQYLEYLNIECGQSDSAASTMLELDEPRFIDTNRITGRGPGGLPLQTVEFNVISTDLKGGVKDRSKHQALSYVESLEAGTRLEMIQIPGGTFLMGTSDADALQASEVHKRYGEPDYNELWHEEPQHIVTVPTFCMGKFEVTQAQWKAVSHLEKVNKDLPINPSRFKGDKLPVDSVSWPDTIEFCERLSRATGRHYRLPTEAEWEYACRAKTTSPFHFGYTITTELANYDGIYPHGFAWWGASRETTIPVGSFGIPNAFGLYDMHGNVEEICLDAWHDTYTDAPANGSAWTASTDDSIHVTRGGGFAHDPCDLRSSSRRKLYGSVDRSYYCGFRVVAVVGN